MQNVAMRRLRFSRKKVFLEVTLFGAYQRGETAEGRHLRYVAEICGSVNRPPRPVMRAKAPSRVRTNGKTLIPSNNWTSGTHSARVGGGMLYRAFAIATWTYKQCFRVDAANHASDGETGMYARRGLPSDARQLLVDPGISKNNSRSYNHIHVTMPSHC